MVWWYFKQEYKSNWSLAFKPISNCCKYRSHSVTTVLTQQVPFSGVYFDEQVPSLQIRITVLLSTDLQTPRTALTGFPETLPVFQNLWTPFFTHVHTQSMPLSRDAASIDENWTVIEGGVQHLVRTVPGRYLLGYHTVTSVCCVESATTSFLLVTEAWKVLVLIITIIRNRLYIFCRYVIHS